MYQSSQFTISDHAEWAYQSSFSCKSNQQYGMNFSDISFASVGFIHHLFKYPLQTLYQLQYA